MKHPNAQLEILKEKAAKAARDQTKRGTTKAKMGLFRYLKPVENFSKFSYEDDSSAAHFSSHNTDNPEKIRSRTNILIILTRKHHEGVKAT